LPPPFALSKKQPCLARASLSGLDDSALGATRFRVRGTLAVIRLFDDSTRFGHNRRSFIKQFPNAIVAQNDVQTLILIQSFPRDKARESNRSDNDDVNGATESRNLNRSAHYN